MGSDCLVMEAEKEKFCPDACEDADNAFSFAPEHIHICVLEAADEMVEFFTRLHVREISESSIQKFTGITNMIG